MEDLRAKFLNSYAKVPEPLRDDIIVVVDEETYTWRTAYLEIKNNKNSELSKKILKTMESIGLI
ncbi:hypothetical protein K9L16_01510 [Candidatus Pacearchaeota archaeon]|nr:hypothetical protein [Candidatus Pacearchaeota archaeon]